MRVRIASLVFLAVGFWAAAHAAPVVTEHVEAELIAARDAAEPGKPLVVALRLKAIPGWHTYWRNPGDSGQPTSIDWKLPAGFAAGAIRWPVPQKLPLGPLANYGYEGEVLLATDIAVPAGVQGPVTLAARAKWLVCNPERCIPESGDFALTLPIGPGKPARWGAAFERINLPRAAPPAEWKLSAWRDGARVLLEVSDAQVRTLSFFPYEEGKVQHAGAQPLERTAGGLRLAIPLAEQPVGVLDRALGILVTEGARAFEIDVPIAGAALASQPGAVPQAKPGVVAPPSLGLALALAFAFVGGLLLNLMPCVLPVLGIKVLGLAKQRSGRAHALLYVMGVVTSFLGLAGLLVALKSAGVALGWGFQLQSPAFIAALAFLFFGLALNLSGVFELGWLAPQTRLAHPHADAFFTGVLAVVVASPCTTPFMGAAMGFAFLESAQTAFFVFAALGIGMALPYAVLAWRTEWLRWLPKPGAWMVRLKQFLAFPLYGTVIWLAWVLGMQAGLDAVVRLLGGLLALGIAAWLAGSMPRARLAALVLAIVAVAAVVPSTRTSPEPLRSEGMWEPWSNERLAALSVQGKSAFVDFTAAWCITCQVNKKLVLSDAVVERAFRDKGVTLLRADWTREDPEITRALADLGRNGVPVYVLYVPGQPPRLLPELLTREAVIAALADLKEAS